jgi:hypothetical protein
MRAADGPPAGGLHPHTAPTAQPDAHRPRSETRLDSNPEPRNRMTRGCVSEQHSARRAPDRIEAHTRRARCSHNWLLLSSSARSVSGSRSTTPNVWLKTTPRRPANSRTDCAPKGRESTSSPPNPMRLLGRTRLEPALAAHPIGRRESLRRCALACLRLHLTFI